MSERNPYEFEKIPDFAMQPAREDIDEFDPEIYERLLAGLEVLEPATEPIPAEAAALEPAPEPVAVTVSESVAVAGPELPQEASPQMAENREGTVVSAGETVLLDGLRLVDMVPCEPVRIHVEEDILVPDVKPDLASILNMDGGLQFTEREQKISGELTLQTLYIPQGKGSDRSIIAMESRLPFQQGTPSRSEAEIQGNMGQESMTMGNAAGDGETEDVLGMKATAKIESLEYSVINERKFRVKAVIAVEGRRYRSRKLELFEGLKGDEVQMLQEKLVATDVILRKTEILELEEDLMLPDSIPEVGKILRCDVNLVENHKQISRDKAVISGTAYYNIMYLPLEGTPTPGQPGGVGTNAADGSVIDREPVLFQAKGEFTQFIPLGRNPRSGEPSGGRTFFQLKKSSAEPKENEGGVRNLIHVKVEGETFAELYRDVERQVVMDAYHHQKEMVFDRSDVGLVQLCPGGIGETTVREVVSVPEGVEGVKRVAFLSGDLRNVESRAENGKNVTEGIVVAKLVCLADDDPSTPFSILRELPFRVASELPPGMEDVTPDNEVKLKELRFDRLNDRQIELNASVTVNGAVICRKHCPMIRNVGFLETNTPEKETPGLILYITRSGDSLWKIARKYRTTIDAVSNINQLDGGAALAPGTKLLIVK